MTIKDFIEKCTERCAGSSSSSSAIRSSSSSAIHSSLYSQAEAKALAWRVLQDLYGIPKLRILTEPSSEICKHTSEGAAIAVSESELEGIIERLTSGKPVQYIVGFETFCGHKFKVAPGVLIPRPETEQLVKIVIEEIKGCERENGQEALRVLDLCTGSGCIAWSIWAALNGGSINSAARTKAEVYACDISEKALQIAENQPIPQPEEGPLPHFFPCDILESDAPKVIKRLAPTFRIIISNPPYITERERTQMHPNVKEHEPAEALFVPDEDPQKFYKAIARIAEETLERGGKLYLECNPLYIEETANLLKESGFANVKILNDFLEKPRFITATAA